MRPLSVGKNLVAATKTTLFTVPARQIAKWNLMWAVNNTASAKNFSAWWYDKSTDTEIAVIVAYPLAAKTFLKFDGGSYVTLEEGDEVRVEVETGATASVLCTFELEATSSVQYNQY
jgi:hypothetical protein